MIARSCETPPHAPDPGLRVEPGIGQKTFQFKFSVRLSVSFVAVRPIKLRCRRGAGGDQAATIHLKSLSDYSLIASPSIINS
jgi:hypothetical protein